MAGVGKSLIGKELAKKLRIPFVDTDLLIEKKTNLPLQRIVDAWGEEKFLKIEEETVMFLSLKGPHVIAPGGSVVYSKQAMNFLRKHGEVVFLKASFKSINAWIQNKTERGIVGLKNKTLKEVFAERMPLYQRYADVTIRLAPHYEPQLVVNKILISLKEKLPVDKLHKND
jgi:shikimate kinase